MCRKSEARPHRAALPRPTAGVPARARTPGAAGDDSVRESHSEHLATYQVEPTTPRRLNSAHPAAGTTEGGECQATAGTSGKGAERNNAELTEGGLCYWRKQWSSTSSAHWKYSTTTRT